VPGRAHRLREPLRGTGRGHHRLSVYQHDDASIDADQHPGHGGTGHDRARRPGIGAALPHQPAVHGLHRLQRGLGRAAGITLILTNHSGTTCHVYGYPGLAFFDGLSMTTHLTWVKDSHATVVLHPGGNAQALLTWRANTATGPAPFNPNLVHVTPPDERAYLWTGWPAGPVLNGEIAAWPLRAAPAGPFPAGTGTISRPFNGLCMTLAADGSTVGARH
jgi:hypothetical protein